MKFSKLALQSAIVLALIALTALLSTDAEAAGSRLRVELGEAVVVNGELHDPGVLTLRQLGNFTPSATLNELWIGGECLGMLLAQTVAGEDLADDSSLLFRRDDAGRLVLTGVAFRGEPTRVLFGYADAPGAGHWIEPSMPEGLLAAR